MCKRWRSYPLLERLFQLSAALNMRIGDAYSLIVRDVFKPRFFWVCDVSVHVFFLFCFLNISKNNYITPSTLHQSPCFSIVF